ncbi:MAG: recombinase family protein, partial [Humibacillus sp.]|nr:recombinase family protein [Humibacillus sp.]
MTAEQLRRHAYLYVRQSSLHQVVNNTESSRRQYDLRGRAVALGWPAEKVTVIDVDQGQSGASATDRAGFQRLVAEVSMGRVGIVLGLECSRLARNNADWHRLLEICALTRTLICDEDGLYDRAAINDRLLLGLKGTMSEEGTMSEAELHFIRARLQGGILAKAARGELAVRLPVGLVYDAAGAVVLDPDTGVRQAINHLFTSFEVTGSASAVVKAFAAEHLRFPGRHLTGPHAGELYWTPLRHDHALSVLHNPRYAGAYCYGRRRQIKDIEGRTHTRLKPREEWTTLIPAAHPGYISWAQFEANQDRLAANAASHGQDRRAGPPREGPALLQGMVVCGRCGKRMTVGYHTRCDGTPVPDYACQREHRHRHPAVPVDVRIRDRRRGRRAGARHAHPAGHADRPRGQRRTHRPGRRRRPDPRRQRRTRRLHRRRRPPPPPRRRPRQPARRRHPGSRLEPQSARARRRPRRLRPGPPGRRRHPHRRAT